MTLLRGECGGLGDRCRLFCLFALQHWVLITSMKPDDQKHVTRDEYIAYFLVAYGVLMPEENVDVSVKLVAIEVRHRIMMLLLLAHRALA